MLRYLNCAFAIALLSAAMFVLPRVAAAQTPQVTDAVLVTSSEGKEVRVIGKTGVRREGKLVSLSNSEVSLRQNGLALVVPLSDVQRIERVRHPVRNFALAGAAAGFAVGLALCSGSCEGGEGLLPHELGLFVAGLGAGAGVVIGAGVNASDSDVLYSAHTGTVAVAVSPMVGPHHAEIGISVRW